MAKCYIATHSGTEVARGAHSLIRETCPWVHVSRRSRFQSLRKQKRCLIVGKEIIVQLIDILKSVHKPGLGSVQGFVPSTFILPDSDAFHLTLAQLQPVVEMLFENEQVSFFVSIC